jgi:hypothetical protein
VVGTDPIGDNSDSDAFASAPSGNLLFAGTERGGVTMEIGKPRRVHRVEPLKQPVPEREDTPAERPETAPAEPEKVPAK